jgi:hypothetical protein
MPIMVLDVKLGNARFGLSINMPERLFEIIEPYL